MSNKYLNLSIIKQRLEALGLATEADSDLSGIETWKDFFSHPKASTWLLAYTENNILPKGAFQMLWLSQLEERKRLLDEYWRRHRKLTDNCNKRIKPLNVYYNANYKPTDKKYDLTKKSVDEDYIVMTNDLKDWYRNMSEIYDNEFVLMTKMLLVD
jgi:hypothetical protein